MNLRSFSNEGAVADLDLSVIILTCGVTGTAMLFRCVETAVAACAAATSAAEVILIDNASTSQVGISISKCFEDLTVLRFSASVGFCTANNTAFRFSRGRFIVQLNDDTAVEKGAFKKILDFMKHHPEVGAVGPRLVNPDGSLQVGYYARKLPTLTDTAFHLLGVNRLWPTNPVNRRHLLLDEPDVSRPVEQPAGAALVYRRSALFALDLLDEDYSFAFDDVDICRRLLNSGWQIYYLREAQVEHHGAGSFNKRFRGLSEHTLNGILCYYSKHATPPQYFVVRIVMLLALGLRIPAALLFPAPGTLRSYFKYVIKLLLSFSKGYTPQRLASCTPSLVQTSVRGLEVRHG